MASQIVFWIALLALGYTWVGFPIAIALLARRRRREAAQRQRWPYVSVIVAAFNEAASIAAKIRSTLEQRYPWNRLELIVVSDGSTDGTDEIVAAWPDSRARLLRQEVRSGKSIALNRGAAAAHGDVLVFTDANAMFAPDAIRRLAKPFADPRVGLVSGQGLYASAASADARAVSNGYVRYEAFIKSAESALGFVAGADGAIYALRRNLYRDLNGAEVNDLLHPIHALVAGCESRFDGGAYTLEPPSEDGRQEWNRHVRIIAQGIHLTRVWLPRLAAAGHWRAVWLLVSHRVLRWATAPLLAAAFCANVALVRRGLVYDATMAIQAVFYLAALAGLVAERRHVGLGRLAIPYYFCLVGASGVAGFVRFLRQGAESVWSPTGQTAIRERAA